MNTKAIIGALGALVVGIALAGCTAASSATDTPPRDLGLESSQAAPEPTPETEEDEFTGIVAFGETIEYVDGVTIGVSAPQPYEPTELAAGADQANAVIFTITITNGSDVKLEPMAYGQMVSGGIEASQIFDSPWEGKGQDVGGGPSSVILPGKSVSWLEAWSVSDPADLQYEISPSSFEYEAAIFTNGN